MRFQLVFKYGSLLLCLLIATAGCLPTTLSEAMSDSNAEAALRVSAASTFGQTFVARHAGLQGVNVYLSVPALAEPRQLTLHLRASAFADSPDLRTAQLTLQGAARTGWFRFDFAPVGESHDQSFYFFVEGDGTQEVALKIGQSPAATYADGALYLNHQAQDMQLAFGLDYGLSEIIRDLLAWLASGLAVVAISLMLFIAPGLALQTYLLPLPALSVVERLCLSAGISLALYPLLMLWTDLAQVHLGALYAWLPVALALAALLWRYRAWRPARGQGSAQWRDWLRAEFFWADVSLLVVGGLILLVRLFVIRSLAVPLWGDSYQHTMIAQLMADHGGLFNSWQPYAEMQTFTYHFGFHSAVAVWHWVTGMEMPQATLLVGQVLNALAVLALYPLAVRVGGNRWAGVGAVLLAGLLSPMPMFYVNWGRYTQLAGQVILPAAVYLAWTLLEADRLNTRWLILSWIVWGGMALAHYRILIFAVLFIAALFILSLRQRPWRATLVRIGALGAGAGLLFLPWFIHVFTGKILLNLSRQLTTPAEATEPWLQAYNSLGDLSLYLPMTLWVLFGLSVVWALWQRARGVLTLVLWWLFVLLVANPQWLRLPGEGAINNFAVFIAAYMPVGIAVGSAWGWLSVRSPFVNRQWSMAIAAVLLMTIGLWGARQRLSDLQVAQSALVTQPDIKAAAWIRENTPRAAKFLVNTFFAYGGYVIVGSDGGWWLPLLARRQTTLPPINYGTEQLPDPNYYQWVNALPLAIQAKGVAHPDVLAMMRERGITHVYIGQQQGRVNYDGPSVLQPEQLLADAHFHPIYHQDRVWVFAVQD